MKNNPYLRHNKEKALFKLIKYNQKHELPTEKYIHELATISATRLVNRNFHIFKNYMCIRSLKKDSRIWNIHKKPKNLIKLLDFIGDNTTFKVIKNG